jgi:hypothetical protein
VGIASRLAAAAGEVALAVALVALVALAATAAAVAAAGREEPR